MEVLAEKFRGLSKGLLPAAGRKGENSSPNPPQYNVQGALGCSFRGKCLSHFPTYFPPGKGTGQPGASPLLLGGAEALQNIWVILGDAEPIHGDNPLPVGTESGERGRERVGEGVPTTKLFLLLLRQLGKKERELNQGIDDSQSWMGSGMYLLAHEFLCQGTQLLSPH